MGRLCSGDVSKSQEAGSLSREFIQVVSAETPAIIPSLQGEHQNPKLNSRARRAETSRSQAKGLLSLFGINPLQNLKSRLHYQHIFLGAIHCKFTSLHQNCINFAFISFRKNVSFLKQCIGQKEVFFRGICQQQRLRLLPFLFLCMWCFFLSGGGGRRCLISLKHGTIKKKQP